MKPKVLIVEDDDSIADIEKDYLEVSGFDVTIASDGVKGCSEALTGKYQVILLDVMLPGMDGFTVCRKIRDKLDVPIIFVTAKQDDIDLIRGYGFGGDSYVVKPFSPGVLVAKVKASLAQYERLKGKNQLKRDRITLGDITLDAATHRVLVKGKEVVLPNKEFQLLRFFMLHPDHVFSRETLYTEIWGMDSLGNTATVPVHVNRLREAIEDDPSNPVHLQTIWGVGYKFIP